MKTLRIFLFIINFVLFCLALFFASLSGMVADISSGNHLLDSLVVLMGWLYFLFVSVAVVYAVIKRENLKLSIKILCLPIFFSIIGVILMFFLNNTFIKQKNVDEKNATQCYEKGYHPVCGVNNKTYVNKCFAEDIKVAYEGECK